MAKFMLPMLLLSGLDVRDAAADEPFVPAVTLQAQMAPKGLSPEDERRFNTLVQSGNRSLTRGMLAAIASSVAASLMLVYGAYKTWRDGLRVSGSLVLKGTVAHLLAV